MPADRKTARSNSETCTLLVHVVPRSSRLNIERLADGSYKIKLTAPPVEGAANAQLTEFLADLADVPKRNVEIVSGSGSRKKIVRIKGIADLKLKPD